jgi:hypothetical protein
VVNRWLFIRKEDDMAGGLRWISVDSEAENIRSDLHINSIDIKNFFMYDNVS